jgi:hypothetical protein
MPKHPTRRQTTAAVSFLSLGTPNEVPMPEYRAPVKRGKQKESLVNDAVKDWANLRGGVLYRNRRGMVRLQNGNMMPIGLGPNGTGDLIGYLTITITPDMVGRKVAVFSMIESKTSTGTLEDHQRDRILEVRDAGGISGCARSAEDSERILQAWRAGR